VQYLAIDRRLADRAPTCDPLEVLTFRSVPMEEEPAASLLDALRAEMAALYDGLVVDAAHMPKAGPDELGPPHGTFIVGFDDDGAPVCCGGVKGLGPGVCEIKRMYVVPDARRSGLGRELLGALEDAARELGYEIARLDTGPRQPHAERLYRDAGYAPIGNFNGNPVASFFGEKPL
jgi:GNAT superfamily N-acetyltransferase